MLLIPGNHEFYGYDDVAKRGDSWQRNLRENTSYYQNQVIRIDDTDFILSTLWSHIKDGHSHTNIDSTIGNTRIVSNQLGYVYSKEHLKNGFDPSKVFEL